MFQNQLIKVFIILLVLFSGFRYNYCQEILYSNLSQEYSYSNNPDSRFLEGCIRAGIKHIYPDNTKNTYAFRFFSSDDSDGETEDSEKEKIVVNEALLNNIKQALDSLSFDSLFYTRFKNIRLYDTLYFSDLKKINSAYEEDLYVKEELHPTPVNKLSYSARSVKNSISGSDTMSRQQTIDKENSGKNLRADNTHSTKYSEKIKNETSDEHGKTKEESHKPKQYSSMNGEIVFRVQIAASRKPLSRNQMKNLYNGSHEISKKNINGWNKYFIGSFKNYESADQVCNESGVAGAFITAFTGNHPLSLSKAISETHNVSASLPIAHSLSVDDLIFRVQIAAARSPIKLKNLNKIYSGNRNIIMNRGQGWYRYSIGNCRSYSHADRLKKSIKVKGAFVVAYNEGIRYNAFDFRNTLPSAPDQNIQSGLPDENHIVFKVQIAACKNKLNKKEIKYIYCGEKNITEIKASPYYKYLIGHFRTYSEAAVLKRKLCVPGAFVVAFEEQKQINIHQAIEKTKSIDNKSNYYEN